MCSTIGMAIVEWTPSVVGSLLTACTKQHSINVGRAIHANIVKVVWWLNRDIYVQNHLMNFYAKCAKMECAHHLFDEIPQKNTVSWTALISGYDQCGKVDIALRMFSLMISEDSASVPNEFTYASAIAACTKHKHSRQGMQLHSHALKRGFYSNILIHNVLISFYMGLGCVAEAELVFQELKEPDQVSWNTLISGFSQNGLLLAALEQFQRMRQLGVVVTSFAISCAITACLDVEAYGKGLHGLAIKLGLIADSFTSCSLIHMYSQTKNIDDGVKVFGELEFKDIASWNSLIEGYAESLQGEEGLRVFCHFMKYGQKPDDITITSILGICANLALLEFGEQVHGLSTKTALDSMGRVQNSLIDMYSKCGVLENGLEIFKGMKERTIISWTTMIGGLAHHGRASHAVQLLEEMRREGLKPNGVTYLCILSACSHGGLLDSGCSVFTSMEIEPEMDHFICMILMLVGGGRFEETKELIQRAPAEHKDLLWQTFLIACKNAGEWERGIEVAEKMMKLGPLEPPTLVLLSSAFAAVGRWDEARLLREEIRERNMKKGPGCSWIEVDNEVQAY
ncbi:hypothetical protein Syun_002996 [Stephania yunnanensis]|uniref:Pentatricopeptide repeat-containing protein n=1 Tax=Stephania yunnanensis TaxID=152371 RepID=A0AAP0L2D3_9MAGN